MLVKPIQFVIIAAIDHTDIALPVEERLALALKRCGVSITCEWWPGITQEKGRRQCRGFPRIDRCPSSRGCLLDGFFLGRGKGALEFREGYGSCTCFKISGIYVSLFLQPRLIHSLFVSLNIVQITTFLASFLFRFFPAAPTSDSSLTNFTAFLLGSITKLPAVEYFCVYAATSILFVFILQVAKNDERGCAKSAR